MKKTFFILTAFLLTSCVSNSKISNIENHLLKSGYGKANRQISLEEKIKNKTLCENVTYAPTELTTAEYTIINYFKYSSEYDTCFIKTLELHFGNTEENRIFISDPLREQSIMSTKMFEYDDIENFWNNLH